MTERRALYMDDNYSYPEEQDLTSDTFTMYGVTIGAGNLAMGSNKITGVPDIPSAGTDAVNKNYVDNIAAGIRWKEPVAVNGLVGNLAVAAINALTPAAADAYVVTDSGTLTAGSVAVTVGDIVEFDGTNWVLVVDAVGGFPPDTTRVILSTATALVSPYTDATDDGKIMDFDGTTLTGADTGDAVDGNGVLVNGEGAYWENDGFVFDGTVPSGVWVQFTGAGNITAGPGLYKAGNTIGVNFGDGITEASDYVAVELSASNPGLELAGTTPDKTLQAKVDGAHGLVLGASGIEIEIDDTPDTLDVDADGLKVVGLPEDFKINDVATHYDDAGTGQVTAPNLDTLTAGSASNADSLHTHASQPSTEAPKVEDTHTCKTAVTTSRAVCWSDTADEIEHGDNSADYTSQIIGVARVGAGAGSDAEVVKCGLCSGLTGLTQRTAYYLGAAGALVVHGSVPRPGRFIRVGFAASATELDVNIMDFGRRAS